MNNAVVTADVVIFRESEDGHIQFLTVKTDKPAFAGRPALPGGKLDPLHDLEVIDTAVREAAEETGLTLHPRDLRLLDVYSMIGRDPRFRSITIAYLYIPILTYGQSLQAHPGSDCKELTWFNTTDEVALAFDHRSIVSTALARPYPVVY
jgi:8-oxo-dGTP diphosphatase